MIRFFSYALCELKTWVLWKAISDLEMYVMCIRFYCCYCYWSDDGCYFCSLCYINSSVLFSRMNILLVLFLMLILYFYWCYRCSKLCISLVLFIISPSPLPSPSLCCWLCYHFCSLCLIWVSFLNWDTTR